MKCRASWSSLGLAVVMVSGACGDDADSTEAESGSTSDQPTEAEQRMECRDALEALEALRCEPPLGMFAHVGDGAAELVVTPFDEATRIELPHGYFIEPTPAEAMVGEVFTHNDHCLIACVVAQTGGHSMCVGVDAEGREVCTLIGPISAEGCEELTDACAGD